MRCGITREAGNLPQASTVGQLAEVLSSFGLPSLDFQSQSNCSLEDRLWRSRELIGDNVKRLVLASPISCRSSAIDQLRPLGLRFMNMPTAIFKRGTGRRAILRRYVTECDDERSGSGGRDWVLSHRRDQRRCARSRRAGAKTVPPVRRAWCL